MSGFFFMGSKLLGGKKKLVVPFDGMRVKEHARGNHSWPSEVTRCLPVTIYRYHLALYYSWVVWSNRIPRSSWIPRYGIRPEKATEHTCDGQEPKKAEYSPVAFGSTHSSWEDSLEDWSNRMATEEGCVGRWEKQIPSKRLGFLTEHQKSYLATLTFLSPHYSHLGFQALKGPMASLGLQASLDHMEVKESLEV